MMAMSNIPTTPASALPRWPSRFWAQASAHDFALAQSNGLAADTVAVLPVAAVEQHGPHLPLSVDASLIDGVIDAALAQLPAELPVLFLPPQNIGFSVEHTHYAGTLSLQPATLIALWTELGTCVARAGIKKLLLLNGHGGQVSVMDIVARELRIRHGLLVYSASWFGLVDDAANQQFCAHEHRFGVHGGEVETSMMLHLAPEDRAYGACAELRLQLGAAGRQIPLHRQWPQRQAGLGHRGLQPGRSRGQFRRRDGRARRGHGAFIGAGPGQVAVRDS